MKTIVVKIDDSMHQKLKHKVIDKKMSLKDYMKLVILNDLDDKKEWLLPTKDANHSKSTPNKVCKHYSIAYLYLAKTNGGFYNGRISKTNKRFCKSF